jgi:hypothetical protein
MESNIKPSFFVSSIFTYPLTARPTMVEVMSLGSSFSSMSAPTSAGVRILRDYLLDTGR